MLKMNLKIGDNLPLRNLWEFKNGVPVEVDIMKSLKEKRLSFLVFQVHLLQPVQPVTCQVFLAHITT